ncbi:MAG: hypothetical protein ACR2JV_04995, partial [Gaiellales bacterium]
APGRTLVGMADSTILPSPARPTIAVPGGRAILIAEVVEPGDDAVGEIVIQTLERADGARFVRLGYRRGGRVIRGPVSLPVDLWSRLSRRPPR